ncbi:ABC transporter permease [Clostridium estertheticum]|nr:ABC transporter permease [Clostridium estertheticum]MCB2307685.1 ABC transporter permease [Clostridium estertheticum]MCB2345985.1 ABC transporter permease [Clostridium estertheticum]MCB2351244.1 ABC transporter permease [Clostridium estertheticum]WAG44665.1 ABC transporter permease [Clostridium estertheticum]
MKGFFTVLNYTFKENSRKKSFIISTIITLILTAVIVSMPAIIKSFDNTSKNKTQQESSNTKTKGVIFVVDSKGILKENSNKLNTVFSQYKFKPETANNIDSLKNKVNKEENNALLILDEKNGVPTFNYIVKQSGDGLDPTALSQYIKSNFVTNLLKEAKVPNNITQMLQTDISFNVSELGKGKIGSSISSVVVSMLLFFSIYFYGYGVAMSIASEKTSRVMELLVTSTKPSIIILGKSAAMGLLGLVQVFMVVCTGLLTYKLTFPDNFSIGGQALDFSSFTPFSVVMIVVYFILGYFLYAMMNAVAGATVSKAEDVTSALMPISFISIAAFYLGYFSLAVPKETVSIVSSIIPFSSPFSMPSRILATEVPIWQITASLLSLFITIAFIAWISIKIYSAAILHYGKRLKLKDLMKISSRNKN